jgi:hypothetical protein
MSRRNETDQDLGLLRYFDPRNTAFLIDDHLPEETQAAAREAVLATRLQSGVQQGEARALEAAKERTKRPDVYRKRHPWEGDQGDTPRCTGFAGVKAWLSGPDTRSANDARVIIAKHSDGAHTAASLATLDDNAVLDLLADLLYRTAAEIDRTIHGLTFEGGGATMLGLAKTGVRLGMWTRYFWGYTYAALRAAKMAGYTPILGIWWREGMDDPIGDKAYVTYTGRYRGGHAIADNAIDVELSEEYGRLDQTWGRRKYGANGYARMSARHQAQAIAEDGEVLIIVKAAA